MKIYKRDTPTFQPREIQSSGKYFIMPYLVNPPLNRSAICTSKKKKPQTFKSRLIFPNQKILFFKGKNRVENFSLTLMKIKLMMRILAFKTEY